MALILGLRPTDTFYIGDVPVHVTEFNDYFKAKVEIEGRTFVVTDKESVEIYPQVYVSCGEPSKAQKLKHHDMLVAALKDKRQRQEAVDSGKMSQEECDKLSPVVFPFDLLPRLIIEAPRRLTILREELYLRGQNVHQQRAKQAGVPNSA